MLTKKKLFIIWLFGSISGFTLMISGSTLNYWLAKEQVDLESIGIFACISIPYAINFIWAPIFDTKKLGYLSFLLGDRLSWICLIQVLLAFFIFILSKVEPSNNIIIFGIIAFIVSFFSSAQDTVLGALRTEIVTKELQGSISGIYIFGYRLGMLMSSSFAIYLSAYISFETIYTIFAIIVITFPIILIFSINVNDSESSLRGVSVGRIVIARSVATWQSQEVIPNKIATLSFGKLAMTIRLIRLPYFLRDLATTICHTRLLLCLMKARNSLGLHHIGTWKFIILVIIFLILYRLPDNFINIMINPFFIHLGYNEFEIASFGKFFGVISAIIGGFVASFIMKKKKITDSLLIFGILHAIAHTMFMVQEIYGKALWLLCISNAMESITGGMVMAAYIAFIASLCDGKFRATQYSFFTSMMGFSRSIFPALSGYIVVKFGWFNFFAFTTILSIPSLILLIKIRNMINQRYYKL